LELFNKYFNISERLNGLLAEHEQVIMDMLKDFEDATVKSKDIATVDFLNGLFVKQETTVWIMRRYLN
jgi:DNA-binding ferritin-like protein